MIDLAIADLPAAGLTGAYIRIVTVAAGGLLISEPLGKTTQTRNKCNAFIEELLRSIDKEEVRSCK